MLKIILGVVVLMSIIYYIGTLFNVFPKKSRKKTRRNQTESPKVEVPNDKLVWIEDITKEEIDKSLVDFCKQYNDEEVQAQMRLFQVTNTTFVVTFPYDVDFVIFCYFINYAKYPTGFDKQFEVLGWATTQVGESWITERLARKKVMLYISDSDTEYDNVFLTTNFDEGFIMGFASGEESKAVGSPEKSYISPKIDYSTLASMSFVEYE